MPEKMIFQVGTQAEATVDGQDKVDFHKVPANSPLKFPVEARSNCLWSFIMIYTISDHQIQVRPLGSNTILTINVSLSLINGWML